MTSALMDLLSETEPDDPDDDSLRQVEALAEACLSDWEEE